MSFLTLPLIFWHMAEIECSNVASSFAHSIKFSKSLHTSFKFYYIFQNCHCAKGWVSHSWLSNGPNNLPIPIWANSQWILFHLGFRIPMTMRAMILCSTLTRSFKSRRWKVKWPWFFKQWDTGIGIAIQILLKMP